MKEKIRPRKVASLLKENISNLLLELPSSKLFESVRITDIKVSSDLKNAKVYVSIYSLKKEKEESIYTKLTQLTGFLRQKLKERLHLRYLPTLQFIRDRSMDEDFKIQQILEEIKHL
jgi:ribosome-binding factor A